MWRLHFCQSEKLYGPEKSGVIWNGSASGVDLKKFDVSQKAVWREAVRKKWEIPEHAVVFGFVGRITGDSVDEQLLDDIFSRFCVGK